eukprot:m51a1_g9685 hypothetical protein (290) ;mRNA; f:1306439-1307675
MSEEAVPVFDPSVKKKKTTKKAAAPAPEPSAEPAQQPQQQQPEPAAAPAEPAAAEDALDFGPKKKKASKKAAAPEAPAEDNSSGAAAAAASEPAAEAQAAAEAPAGEQAAQPEAPRKQATTSWPQDSAYEYSYEDLCGRIFEILRTNNPEFGERSAVFVMKPPQIGREGKKTIWFNFADMCRLMNRKLDHVMQFAFAELGTNGSLDGNNRLVIRGRFQHKHIETIVRKYIKEYVTCNTCNTASTVLKKENRLTFVVCTACNSSRSVSAIKKGFEAQITKRRLDKEKAQK